MGAKKRTRTRDLPHPSPSVSKPERGDFNGSASRKKRKHADGWAGGAVKDAKRRAPSEASAWDQPGAHDRIDGPNGSWPAQRDERPVVPRPPALCLFYDDLGAGEDPVPVFGQYPAGLIGKLLPYIGCGRHEILHLCSGALKRGEGIRVDIRPDAQPDHVADATSLPRDIFPDGSAAAVMLDPPYTPEYAERLYGVKYPLPAHLLAEAARVVRPGGMIAFVHYLVPMPPEGVRFVRAWGLSTGFGFPMRAVTLFQKEQAMLPLEAPPERLVPCAIGEGCDCGGWHAA